MFKSILAPVDLAHVDRLGHALDATADVEKHYGAPVTYVGVTSHAPGAIAHTAKEFEAKLEDFVEGQAKTHGIEATARTEISHDPTSDVDEVLMRVIKDTGCDLVVMASHVPNVMDYVLPSNGGKIAEHADCSVMVVRS